MKFSEHFAKHLITQNISDTCIIHIQQNSTSNVTWSNLEAIYKDKSQETVVAVIHNLWHTTAKEEDDISEDLITLMKYWKHLNLVEDSSFKISEIQFKITIISSLPPSWDTFTSPYESVHKGDSTDPKLLVTSQELIRIPKEECI